MKLTNEQILAQLKLQKQGGKQPAQEIDISLDEIESFGNEESLREIALDIVKYNSMLKEKIPFINDDLSCIIPFTKENLYLIGAYTGSGKCFAKGTKILMYDGSSKPVEDVAVNDLVMGPDSKPRRVLSLARGREMMYDVLPVKGDKYTVNESHTLSLRLGVSRKIFKNSIKNDVVNLSVKDYLQKSSSFKHSYKGYRTGVDFKPQSVTIDPYVLGYWLGDGSSDTLRIVTADYEVVDAFKKAIRIFNLDKKPKFPLLLRRGVTKGAASDYDISVGRTGVAGSNLLKEEFKKLNLFKNKHIPNMFKINSEKVRLELLAGLVDSDGSSNSNGLDICFKNKVLAEDTLFLARSLGFAAYLTKTRKKCYNSPTQAIGTYYRISISGDLDRIPTKIKRKQRPKRKQIKNVLNVGIKVKEVGVGDYYGFSVDGDHLFLLSDFTVVHNSTIAANITYPLWQNSKKTLVISNEEDKKDVLFRVACIHLGLNFNDFKKGTMSHEDQKRAFALFEDIGKHVKVLDVSYKGGITTKVEGIKSALEAVKKDNSYSCVLIDYFQLVKYSVNDPKKTAYENLNDLRIWLGQYIKSSTMPVVLFAQLYSLSKRGGAKDFDARVKDCSAIVEPATVIIEAIPNFETKTTDFCIVKDRFGFTGKKITCGFDRGKFIDLTPDDLAKRELDAKLSKTQEKLSKLDSLVKAEK